MTFRHEENQQDSEESIDEHETIAKDERLVLALFMTVVSSFMLFDLVDDYHEGIAVYHLLPEAICGIVGVGTAFYLFSRFLQKRHKALSHARQEVAMARKSASEWQQQASTFRTGLTEAITKQLRAWNLTEAEQDICFLLLKGFSLQEIADLRHTSERTVRQQASIIYRKSGLSGRVQLAAFFLEDLLSPAG